MKKAGLLFLLLCQFAFAQQAYYNDVDLNLTGGNLYNALQMKISQHNVNFNYGDARDVLPFTDEDPANTNNVLLIYGYSDTDGNCTTDRSRNKNSFGGTSCEYNREHVYARSLPNPDMGTANNSSTGIVADPHNLRASDQQMNNDRGSKLFQNGSGTAGNVGSGNWYPGDEWKGDVARMVMYMYTRYGQQCLPSYVGVGNLEGSTQMLQTFLQWNTDDPVNSYEDQRNNYLENVYGNRNPFIDNPYLATEIWGGPAAEDRWGTMDTQDVTAFDFVMYPNPVSGNIVYIQSQIAVEEVVIYDLNGRVLFKKENQSTTTTNINTDNFPVGMYLVKISSEKGNSTQKLIRK